MLHQVMCRILNVLIFKHVHSNVSRLLILIDYLVLPCMLCLIMQNILTSSEGTRNVNVDRVLLKSAAFTD